MIALIGTIALWLALATAATLMAVSVRVFRNPSSNPAVLSRLAFFQFALLLLSFVSTVFVFVLSDFSVATVYKNSHSTKPLLYKITGTWGNHEGSILLWALVSAAFSSVFAAKSYAVLSRKFYSAVLFTLGLTALGIVAYTAVLSSPLATNAGPVPPDGLGMNPVLQDIGIAIHPPVLYLGYVGLVIPFALAVGAMLSGTPAKRWAAVTLPWTYIALGFLTIGIILGAWWAYRELGWGGWWFWDPVENVSVLPWFVAAALSHSLLSLRTRGNLQSWSVFLAVSAFGMSILGAFLVRSGVLVSVHSFAAAPARGLALLAYLVILVGFALTVFALKPFPRQEIKAYDLTSRETFLNIHNVFGISAALVILLGTLYPVIFQAFGMRPLSIGAKYFSAAVIPLLIAALVFMAVAPEAPWRKGKLGVLAKRLALPLMIGVIAGGLVLALTHAAPKAVIAMIASVTLTAAVLRHGERQRGTVKPAWALIVSHLGVGIFAIGASASYGWSTTFSGNFTEGETLQTQGYTVKLNAVTPFDGPNYLVAKGSVSIEKSGKTKLFHPEYRIYKVTARPTTEADIRPTVWGDTHVTLNVVDDNRTEDRQWAVKVQTRPLQIWVWIGAFITALGLFMAARGHWNQTYHPAKDET